tara:strand:- start:387 stop:728 length:342 start_codon:yes stop_codon:yes gene_type:complete
MASDENDMGEVLNQLKIISTSVVSSEYLRSELGHLKENTDIKVSDLKEDLQEVKIELKTMHDNFHKMDSVLNEFKMEMKPIIDFKREIQTKIIRLSAIAFTTLLALTVGMGSV